jgi:hypothetical protein
MRDLNQIIRGLTDITITAGRWQKMQERLNDIQYAIKALARGDNIESGKHIQKRQLNDHTISITGTPGGGKGATDEDWPFKPYASSYTGSDDAPTDQPLRLRIIAGTVSNKLAINWNMEFTMPAGKELYWCWLEVNLDAGGNVLSSEYKFGDEPPVAEVPTEGGEIASPVYIPLFSLDTSKTAIATFYSTRKANIRVSVTTSSGCTTAYRVLSIY